jgi:hypothetical protein
VSLELSIGGDGAGGISSELSESLESRSMMWFEVDHTTGQTLPDL